MAKARILIVEDDLSLAEVLSYNIRNEGYEVTLAHDGQDGLTRAQLSPPDLVILDVMLPVIDGMDVCRRLRADSATRDVLILMLTAKAEELDELVGLSLGADDFVTKPFSVKVLLERIKALLRRRQPEVADGTVIHCHGIVIDRSRHKVTSSGRSLELTRSEFRLLDTLIRQPGRVFQRSELIDAALGDDAIVMERTIDVHIRALRRKLGAHADVIETVRGVGYRFRDSDAAVVD
ncbi:MAG TPA: response regulator [Pirellulaceae bacterium]|nr:response regulator [Planctomycetales bacterium]MCB9938407.1 response regulator [Planctomycetaceae bacterium]HRX79073.1 response regulator [Pirellulaceae bacterium]